jgi:5-methylcytosine-specific restriction endonuclease McrA
MTTSMPNVSVLHEKVKAKFKYRCIICFRPYTHLHHIVPRSLGGKDEEDNLVTLCYSHHRKVHNSGATNWTDTLKQKVKDFERQI